VVEEYRIIVRKNHGLDGLIEEDAESAKIHEGSFGWPSGRALADVANASRRAQRPAISHY